MTNEKNKPKELKIKVPEKVQYPIFSNIAQVHATDREVIIDFAFLQPNSTEGVIVARIALTPEHALSLKDVLLKTLERYGAGKK